MITGLDEQIQFKSWQEELKNGFDNSKSLLAYLNLAPQHEIPHAFPMRVPLAFAQKIEKDNPNDPLLKQVLISKQEVIQLNGYKLDPHEEQVQSPTPGLIHKYFGRVLVMPTSACAIHCRYCFRKHFPYDEHKLTMTNKDALIDYIERHTELFEVILSGGDPLMLPDKPLIAFLDRLSEIAHLKSIRFHTRLPIVLPNRITKAFLNWCQSSTKQIVLVTHSNHPNELGEDVHEKLVKLKQHGVTLLNQAVLLQDINDNIITLEGLSHKLFESGVLPYYLHLPDRVAGTHHFDVTRKTGQKLIEQLQAKLPGYLVPKFVVEETFAKSKTVLA